MEGKEDEESVRVGYGGEVSSAKSAKFKLTRLSQLRLKGHGIESPPDSPYVYESVELHDNGFG